VTSHWTVMKCRHNLLLQCNITTQPNVVLIFDDALLQTEWRPGRRVHNQLREQRLSFSIRLVPLRQVRQPVMHWR
jgi:hypothetical protein